MSTTTMDPQTAPTPITRATAKRGRKSKGTPPPALSEADRQFAEVIDAAVAIVRERLDEDDPAILEAFKAEVQAIGDRGAYLVHRLFALTHDVDFDVCQNAIVLLAGVLTASPTLWRSAEGPLCDLVRYDVVRATRWLAIMLLAERGPDTPAVRAAFDAAAREPDLAGPAQLGLKRLTERGAAAASAH